MDLPDRPFLPRDAQRLGLDETDLARLERAGCVRRVLRGVYLRTDVEATPLVRTRAAALALPRGAVVCDETARWLHGIDAGLTTAESPPRLDVAARHGHEASSRPELFACKRTIPDQDVTTLHGVAVTTPLRTAADLACRRGRLDAIAVLDAFSRVHGLTPRDYERITQRFRGRRGVTQLRELGPLATPKAESPPESWVRLTALDHRLPPLEPQLDVLLPGGGAARLDLGLERAKIAVEYDGVRHHSSAEDRSHDERRRAALHAAGWVVIVVRSDGFSEPGLSRWIRELREACAERCEGRRRVYARGEEQPWSVLHRW